MSKRSSLFVGVFLVSAIAGAGDSTDARNALTASRHCRAVQCTVGEVQPLLTVQDYGAFTGAWFEGVATGRNGSIYTSEQCTGDVYRLRPNGEKKVIARIPYGVTNDPDCTVAGTLGLAVSEDGDVWVVVISWMPESHGIWRVHRNGTAELAVPLSPEDVPVPNAIGFDPDGNLYITESIIGAIWKARPGGPAELWLQHDLLAPTGGFGANGIAFRHGALYVANTDQGTIVKVPLRRDGSPGDPLVIATGLNGPDGVTVDAFGNLYLVTAYGAQLVRFRPGGTPEIVLDLAANGVSWPASVDLGKIAREMNTAYIANFVPQPGEPNLVKVNLCERH
jgi:sugar lactone lactonase YvrE